MKLLFAKTFTGAPPRRPGDLRAKPIEVEVFENDGRRWIRGLRLATLLGISTSTLRQAVKDSPELQDDRHNQLVSLEGETSGPIRMLSIEGARRLAGFSGPRRRSSVIKFLDEIDGRNDAPAKPPTVQIRRRIPNGRNV
jgi:hypothetical protein